MRNNKPFTRLNPEEIDARFNSMSKKFQILSVAEIKSGIQKAFMRQTKPHELLLKELLSQVQNIDFNQIADKETVKQKDFVVIVVSELKKLAAANDWGICTRHGNIYLYNGAYWRVVDKEHFQSFLGDVAQQMGVAQLDARYHRFKDELLKQFLSDGYMDMPSRSKNKVLVNVLNGTLVVTDGNYQLNDHDRNDFLTYQLPFEYNPDTEHPLFQRFLNRVLPNVEAQQVLAEYVGYVFAQSLKLEKVLILYGSGANGKSVFFDVVNALFGHENVSNYSLQNLTRYDSYQRASLENKLVNYASEINGRLEASIFKQLASGEPVEARQIYGQPFTMTNYARLIFNCNELPKETEQTHAFFRRFIIMPFDVTIPAEEQDPELASKIISTELSGVLNWALSGLERLMRNKRFTCCDAITRQLEQYQRESDSVAKRIKYSGKY